MYKQLMAPPLFPLRLVVATVVMAVARKVIIVGFKFVEPMHIFSLGSIVLAFGIAYYLLGQNHDETIT